MRAKIQVVADDTFPAPTPTTIPSRHKSDDTQLYTSACFADMPALSNIAKSPVLRYTLCYIMLHCITLHTVTLSYSMLHIV